MTPSRPIRFSTVKPAMIWLALCFLMLPRADAALSDTERMARLARTPIAVYPDFEVGGSRLVPLLNERAREGDALVVSYTEAFKGDFRVEQLKLIRPEVWLYVRGVPDLRHAYRRQTDGLKGLVFVPEAGAKGRGEMRNLGLTMQRLREDADALGLRLVAGLEEPDFRLVGNAAEIARHAQIVTVYLPHMISAGGQAFRPKFEKLVAEARQANPSVQVELAIPTGTPQATQALAGLAFSNIDLADRLAIYCKDTSESYASLEKMFRVFRPQ